VGAGLAAGWGAGVGGGACAGVVAGVGAGVGVTGLLVPELPPQEAKKIIAITEMKCFKSFKLILSAMFCL